MKSYKPTYCISLLFFIIKIIILCIPSAIILGIVMGAESTLMIIVGVVVSILAYLILVLLINLIIKAFSKNEVLLGQKEIYYQGQKICLDDIQYITLYFPILLRFSSKPQTLSLWCNDKNHIVIKRPSLALIIRLKKICLNAKFEINEWKSMIKWDIIISLCVAVILTVIILFIN